MRTDPVLNSLSQNGNSPVSQGGQYRVTKACYSRDMFKLISWGAKEGPYIRPFKGLIRPFLGPPGD